MMNSQNETAKSPPSGRRSATMSQPSSADSLHPRRDFVNYVREYARENPEIAALWCVGVGFILGWKLKPW